MTITEWMNCDDPDLMLEEVMETISREQLVMYVRQCWQRIRPFLPNVSQELTVVDQYAHIANQLNNRDAVIYASEAALKAAGFAPNIREEQRQQARLLRGIVGKFKPAAEKK
jgi:hypothetical protein